MPKTIEDQYLEISDKLSDLDKLIVGTVNKDELEKLIRKRKPLADELIALYKKIYIKEKEAKMNEST